MQNQKTHLFNFFQKNRIFSDIFIQQRTGLRNMKKIIEQIDKQNTKTLNRKKRKEKILLKKNKQRQALHSEIEEKLAANLIRKNNINKQQITEKNNNVHVSSLDEKTLTGQYLARVKKIEGITEKMENKNKQKIFSFKTLFKQGSTSVNEKSLPEFLELTPYEIPIAHNQKQAKITYAHEEMNLPIFQNNSSLKIGMMGSQSTIAESFDEISTEQDEKENYDHSQISEMEPMHKQNQASPNKRKREWMLTSIDGFDGLLEKGIPTGSNIIIAGGPGCGKTIFCTQVIYNKALEGKDCVFLSMEERPDRLLHHMREFGFKVTEIETSQEQIILRADGKGRIALKRLQPIRLARSIEALLEKASGTLPVDIDLVLDFIPKDFDPYLLALDSLSAIETAFSGTKRQYRIYIEQLFRYFEELDITTFMITESSDAPHKFSSTGVEEFLADGIFVFYNFPGVKKRTRGIEIYKLRGAPHSQKIMTLNINDSGIEIVSDQPSK